MRLISTTAAEIERDLRAIRQILRQPLEADIARGGFTGPQQSCLQALVASGGMSLKELSKALGLAHSTVSGIVDRLEKRGVVERQIDKADRRISKIAATETVLAYVRDMPSMEQLPLAAALRHAAPAQRQQVRDGIRILRELLERHNQKPPVRKTNRSLS